MQVLHIISGLGDGGAEAVLYRLCKSNKDHDHVVISLTGNQKYGPLLKEIGIDVYSLNILGDGMKLMSLGKLFKLIKQLKPDLVQTWMIHADLIGGLVARAAGIKNIYWGVHHTKLAGGRLIYVIGKINAFLSYFLPKKIIYCADMSRKAQESIGFCRAKGFVIHNGYDLDDFSPDFEQSLEIRNELKISKSTFLIGHVGRFDPLKDLKTLIESFDLLKQKELDFKVIIVGTGLDNNNKDLLNYINQRDLKPFIYLLGKRDDIPSVMNSLDVFVLSSKTEAFPNVLNEAMACGTPCITTDVGDASFIVGDTGWITPIANPGLIGSAILEAINEKEFQSERWQQRKLDCRERITQNFSIEKMIQKYNLIWQSK